jgi:uncharacterized protein YjbI with pentapeptide repeats
VTKVDEASSPEGAKSKPVEVSIQRSPREERWQRVQAFGTLAISAAVACLTYYQVETARKAGEREMEIAENHQATNVSTAKDNRAADEARAKEEQQHQIMSNYLNEMTKLLIDHNLKQSDNDSPVRTVARSITLNTARRLDSERKGQLIKFLYEADLIDTCPEETTASFREFSSNTSCNNDSIIKLEEARLEEARFDYRPVIFRGIDLEEVDLSNAELKEIDLSYAVMDKAVLTGANLDNAILSEAKMSSIQMQNADLSSANLIGTNLQKAILIDSSFENADLSKADLRCAQLQGAKLDKAKTDDKTNFQGAQYDNKTTFPEDFQPQKFNMLKIDLDKNANEICVDGQRIPLPSPSAS